MSGENVEARLVKDQNVIVGMAHTDVKKRIVLPAGVVTELGINRGDDLIFFRVGSQDGSGAKGVAAYPGNIIISRIEDELTRTKAFKRFVKSQKKAKKKKE
jgi:bifunctional DNA-binding transcriptional regulator/antitoxin component of YhaV-PrlF toxin-antitoxin module